MSRTLSVLSAASRRMSGGVLVWALIAAAVGLPLVCQELGSTANRDLQHRQAANEASRMLCRWHADGRVSFRCADDGCIFAEVHIPAQDWNALSAAARNVVRADVSTAVRWHGRPIAHYLILDETGALLARDGRAEAGG